MTLAQVVVVFVVVVPLLLAFLEKIKIDTAALLILCLLGLAQYAGLGIFAAAGTPGAATRAIAGFGQPVVITLIGLFILTYCLDRAGVTRWIAARVLRLAGTSERRLIGLFTLTAALLSLFMNNVAAGALLIPSALEAARRTGTAPSKLLMPISFGTLLGGAATYFTTANIIASDLLTTANPPQAALHILDFTPTGSFMALAGIAFIVLVGPRLLPNRTPQTIPIADNAAPQMSQRDAILSVGVTALAITAAILGVPTSLAVLAGALVLILIGIVSMREVYQAIEWRVIFPVAGIYSVGLAMVGTGLAALLGQALIGIAGPFGPLGLVVEVFLITALLTQFIGGQVAANVTGPIAISAAIAAGTNPQAIAVVTAIGCSAAFFTPLAHPVNLLMVDVGGYKFSDFPRVGIGLFIVCFVAVVIAVPLFWKL